MSTSAVVVVIVGVLLTACGRLGFEEQHAASDHDAAAFQLDDADALAEVAPDAAPHDAGQRTTPTPDAAVATPDPVPDAALHVFDAGDPDANSTLTEPDAAIAPDPRIEPDATTAPEDANMLDAATIADATPMDSAMPDASIQDAAPADSNAADAAPEKCPAVAPKAGTHPLIDDLEDGDGVLLDADGRRGFWYTTNDGTAGTQTPVPGTTFVPASAGAHGSSYFARATGRNFSDWGAALCIMLHQAGDNSCRYNATGTSGLRFSTRGTGTITISVATAATVPIESGGSCFSGCYDYHATTFTLTSTWITRQISYASLAQGGWGTAAFFQPSALMYIEFAAGPNVTFDIGIDDISFY